MSSFLVSDEHISVLAEAAHRFSSYGPFRYVHAGSIHKPTKDELGKILRAENIQGQIDRYGEDDGAPVYTHPRTLPTRYATPTETLKAVACYEYQACESSTYETSEAKAICEAITKAAINALPRYDEGPWEWNAEDMIPRSRRTA